VSAERAIYDEAAHQKSKRVHLPPLRASARNRIGRGEGAPRENAGTNTPHQLVIYPPERNCPIDLWLHRWCNTVSDTGELRKYRNPRCVGGVEENAHHEGC
jgi:hypothetical protein